MGVQKSHFYSLRAFSLLSFKGLLQIMEMSVSHKLLKDILQSSPYKTSYNFLGGNCPPEVDITLWFYFAFLLSQC